MARVVCVRCGKNYSDRVDRCPECGEPKPTHLWRKVRRFLEVVVIIAVIYGGWHFLQTKGYLQGLF